MWVVINVAAPRNQNQRERDLESYLTALQKNQVDPNFWCSPEYFSSAGCTTRTDLLGWQYIQDAGVTVVPPLNIKNKQSHFMTGHLDPGTLVCWSDFPNTAFPGCSTEYLDHEFIYDPRSFLKLSGKKWAIFRKNIRKWAKRNYGDIDLHYFVLDPQNTMWDTEINNLVISWLTYRAHQEIAGGEELIKYAVFGKNRALLVSDKLGLLGMNIWDENYKYVNYRFTFCRPGEPFLDELLRYRFYTSPEILEKSKLVNDGGCLGNESLKNFKLRLNPVRTRSVYSWRKV